MSQSIPSAGDNGQPKGRTLYLILTALVLAALLFRIHTATGRYERGDSIIVALMANDIATGVQYPLWYYGGPYAGTLESWLTAPVIWFFGPQWWIIPFAPLVISTIGVLAFYALGSTIGGTRVGLFAAILWTFAPWGASFYNISPRGCYPETICGGAMILWYATKRWKGETVSVSVSFLIGLLAGLLIWSRMLAAPYVITLAGILLLVDRTRVINTRSIAGAAGILMGALPFLFAWRQVLSQPAVGKLELTGIGERASALHETISQGFATVGPAIPAWASTLGMAGYYFFLTATVAYVSFAAVATVRGVIKPRQITIMPLALFVFVFTAMFLANSASLTVQVRYALPFYTALIVFTALAVDRIAAWSNRWVGAVLILFLAGSSAIVTELNFGEVRKEENPVQKLVSSAVAELGKMGAKSVVVNDYNLMERFFYEGLTSGIPLNVMADSGNLHMRWTTAVERDDNPVFIINPAQSAMWDIWLKSCCGGEYSKRPVGGSDALHNIKVIAWPSVSIPPEQWNVTQKAASLADRSHFTTFWSGEREEVVMKFDQPRDLTKIRVIYGNRWPESMEIESSMDGVTWETISAPQTPSRLLQIDGRVYARHPWEYDREHEEWNFPPKSATHLRLTLTPNGAEPFDIHELFIYESSGKQLPDPSLDEIQHAAEKEGVTTLACNRRISANFYGRRIPFKTTFSPFIESPQELAQAKWPVTPGFAALVDRADAAELESRLRHEKAVFTATPIGNKTLFVFKQDAGVMWWTGFTSLKSD